MTTFEERVEHMLDQKTLSRVRKRIGDNEKSDSFIRGLKTIETLSPVNRKSILRSYKLKRDTQQHSTLRRMHKLTKELLETLGKMSQAKNVPNIEDDLNELYLRLDMENNGEAVIAGLMSLYGKTTHVLEQHSRGKGGEPTDADTAQLIKHISFIFKIKFTDEEKSYEKDSLFHDLICILLDVGYAENVIKKTLNLPEKQKKPIPL